MKLIYNAQFADPSGYGKCARDYLKALDIFMQNNPNKLELRINIVSFDDQRALTESEQELIKKYLFKNPEERQGWLDSDFVFIGHHVPPQFLLHETNRDFIKAAKKRLNMTVWETTNLPAEWQMVAKSGKVDAFIVPCQWNGSVFSRTGIKTFILPHVVAPVKCEKNSGSDFIILAISQWIKRKNWEKLVKAFLMEFHDTDAKLVIKSFRSNASKKEQEKIIADVKRWRGDIALPNGKSSNAKIIFIGELLTSNQMQRLYESCDVFALASHGEGFGLPYSESIAHGKPVISPDKGGHVDFAKAEDNYLFNSYFDSCHGMGPLYDCSMNWIDTSIVEIRKALQKAYIDFLGGELRTPSIGPEYSYQAVGEKLYQMIKEVIA